MKCRVGASLLIIAAATSLSGVAQAAKLPQIKASKSNSVPACVTPGRLMAYLDSRNGRLKSKFKKIAVQYMRHGEALGIRWDQAFFQMLVETNSLKYGRDVSARQNNFAGLGATGGGKPGESFDNVSDGVKAHLQHILMYSGEHIDDPVADRTRNVQKWGILDKWRSRIGRPLTYTDLTTKWSPGDRGYSRDIKVIGDRFNSKYCNNADPHPEWLAEARSFNAKTRVAEQDGAITRDYAKEAVARGKRDEANTRLGLGANSMAAAGSVPFKMLNKVPTADTAPAVSDKMANAASLPGGSAPGKAAKNKAPGNGLKCNVFTASYGGEKAVIIKAVSAGKINYTVLDINAGRENSETQAYIAAYARGGTTVGSFSNQAQALDKAFELCPEG